METHDVWKEHDIKKTKQRAMLLDILEEMELPLPAAQIHNLYLQKDPGAWISTTYRTLELFIEKGIVNKVMFLDNVQYELNRNEHKHYAFCKCCKKVMNLDNCPIENFPVNTQEGGFYVTGHRLEIYGYCEECHKKNDKI